MEAASLHIVGKTQHAHVPAAYKLLTVPARPRRHRVRC